MQEDIDDFLGFSDKSENDTGKNTAKDSEVKESFINSEKDSNIECNTPINTIDESRISILNMESKEVYPLLMGGESVPIDFKLMVERILFQYKNLPYLKYDEIYSEISQLSIKSCPTPTLAILNLELERVQASKDRLSEIFVDVLKNHTFKKRAVDILRDSWGKFSVEKSADKRKGEAAFIVSDFECDFALVEALLKASTHVLKNLDSLHDNLSRRITIIQLQLKLHDVGRGALPDFNFDKPQSIYDEISLTKESGEKNDTMSFIED